MKKMISIIALVSLMLTMCAVLFVSGSASEYTEKKIAVDLNGKYYERQIFVSKSGKILINMNVLASWGGMVQTQSGSEYIFCYKQQKKVTEFKKEIHITATGGESVYYNAKGAKRTLAKTSFSESYSLEEYGETQLFLPLTELLPFLDAKLEIANDGILHVYPNPMPLFLALETTPWVELAYRFNAETDVAYSEIYGATGYILDSVFNGLRFDRLDFITQSGKIKDYRSIFKKLLTDNETYLEAFDKDKTPIDDAFSDLDDNLSWVTDRAEMVNDYFSYITKSEIKKDLATFGEFSGALDESLKVVDGALKVLKYTDAYINQVDDHREMLTAVYGGKYYDKSDAACLAANEVAAIYGKDTAGVIVGATTSALRDSLTKIVSGALTEGIKPYKIALKWVELTLPDAMDEFSDAAKLFYVDSIIDDALEVYNDYRDAYPVDAASLNNMRLSIMLALETSKYAFEAYADADDVLDEVNALLTKLYLAADSVDCSPEYSYTTQKSRLNNTINLLKAVDVETSEPTGTESEEETTEDHRIAFGKCGSKATWTLYDDGKLVIDGEGEMKDVLGRDFFYSYGEKIRTIVIGKGITRILIERDWTLYNLLNLIVEEGNPVYHSDSDCIIHTADKRLILGCDSSIIPSDGSVKIIGAHSFYFSEKKSIDIPEGIAIIEEGAFQDSMLTKVILPNTLNIIGSEAFIGCEELQSINIPSSVTHIGDQAFYFTALKTLHIPLNVIYVGDSIVNGGDPDYLDYDGTIEEWKTITGNYSWLSWYGEDLMINCKDGTYMHPCDAVYSDW